MNLVWPPAGEPGPLAASLRGLVVMRNVEPLHRENPLSTIRLEHDPSHDSHWCFMHGQQAFSDPNYRAFFSPRQLGELRMFAQETIDGSAGDAVRLETHRAPIVLSAEGSVINLGGDP